MNILKGTGQWRWQVWAQRADADPGKPNPWVKFKTYRDDDIDAAGHTLGVLVNQGYRAKVVDKQTGELYFSIERTGGRL